MKFEQPNSPQKEPAKPRSGSHSTTIGGKTYDVYKLIKIAESTNLPQQKTELIQFRELLSAEDGWTDKKGNELGPKNIIELYQKYNGKWNAMLLAKPNWIEHIHKTRDADLSHPILIQKNYTVVDGVHRLTKAYLDNQESISTRIFDQLPDEALINSQ